MEYHSVLSKVSYVLDQYIYYKLVPEKGYAYQVTDRDLVIRYKFVETLPTNCTVEVYQEKRCQLFDFLRKAAKVMIQLDAYAKITIQQCNSQGEEEFVEEVC